MSLSATQATTRASLNPGTFYEAKDLKELTIAVSPASFGRGQRKAIKAALKAAICSGEIIPVFGPNGEVGYASKHSMFKRFVPNSAGGSVESKLGKAGLRSVEMVTA